MNALKMVALGLGGIGVVGGAWALRFPKEAQDFLRKLPRNEMVGRVLMLVDVAWSIWLFNKMDLGGWNWAKQPVTVLSPFIYLYIIFLVNNYLGARSLALFMILLAKPVVNICFLRDEPSRLVITTLAYVWVVAGICIFSVPHWLRDWIGYWEASATRWAWGCRAKVAFGCLLIALGIFAY